MKGIFEWVKEHKAMTIVALALITLIPLLIILAYWIGRNYGGIPSDFDANSLLAYWGAVLAFGGTVYLGYVANSQNARLIEIEEHRQKPIIDLQPLKRYEFDQELLVIKEMNQGESKEDKYETFYFICKNISDQFISDIKLTEYTVFYNSEAVITKKKIDSWSINSTLGPGQERHSQIALIMDSNSQKPNAFTFEFELLAVGRRVYVEKIWFFMLSYADSDEDKLIYTAGKEISIVSKK